MLKTIPFLAGLVCLPIAVVAFAVDRAYEIVPGERVGHIGPKSTQPEIEKAYGADNVKAAEVYLGEGQVQKGLLVFPNDPKRKLEVLWKENGQGPKHILISRARSLWKTKDGISLGTSLKELEKLNGKPFAMGGFGWDYSGTVFSWEGGRLEPMQGKLMLRLDNNSESLQLTEQERSSVLGDKSFSSSHPVMQKINPTVYQMVVIF